MSEENKPEKEAEDSISQGNEHINLTVRTQDNSSVHFKIKKNTPLRRLINAYCEKTGVQQAMLKFMFDGTPVTETETPATLEMEDDDVIEVFQHQTGGHHP